MMKKIRLIGIGLMVFFLTVSSVYAETQYSGRSGGGKIKEGIYKDLNLTPEQQKKLEDNRKAQREETTQLRTAMRAKEKELQQALKDPAVTKAGVQPLVNEIKSLQGQLIDHRVSGIFAVKQILTPEQIAKFNQLMEKRKDGKGGRFQNWRQQRTGHDYNQEG
jgi:Spy/CpxP family protein refolding chaperone